jgi:hypothetical protein
VAVNGTQFAAGGLVGSNSGNIRASAAAGNVNGKKNVGGLVGQNIGYMFDTYADVRVSGDEFVGGLIGSSNDRSGIPGPTTLRSYAVGPVNGDQYVGGIISFADSGSYGSLYWDTTVSGATDSDKGTGLTTEEMTGPAAKSNMPGLAFGSVWKTQSNDYPILAWQNDGVDYDKGRATDNDTDHSGSAQVKLSNISLTPQSVDPDSQSTHQLTFEAQNVSADGIEDEFEIIFPEKVSLDSFSDVAVDETSSPVNKVDNTLEFSVDPTGGGSTQIAGELNVTVSATN